MSPRRKTAVRSMLDAPSHWLGACSSLSILACGMGTYHLTWTLKEGQGLHQCHLPGHPWAACLCGLTEMAPAEPTRWHVHSMASWYRPHSSEDGLVCALHEATPRGLFNTHEPGLVAPLGLLGEDTG